MTDPPPLQRDAIERDLGTTRVGRDVICFPEVASTNDTAADAARGGRADGRVIFAEHQTRGRGRHGRLWQAPPGANLLFSVVLGEPFPPAEATPIAAGLAVAEGVESASGLRCRLKWPNDVLLDESKVAGVLVEARAVAGGVLIIGIGVNVHAAPPAAGLHRPATCLADRLPDTPDRVAVARAILRRLDAWVVELAADPHGGRASPPGGLARLHDAFAARCMMLGRRVRLAWGGREAEGRVVDVDPLAGLAVRPDRGGLIHVPAAEATILDLSAS